MCLTRGCAGRYSFTDSGSNREHRAEQSDNWFMVHPDGAVRVAWADGVGPTTRLEELEGGLRVATLTFLSRGGEASTHCDVVADTGSMQLHCRWEQTPAFLLDKDWVHFWQ